MSYIYHIKYIKRICQLIGLSIYEYVKCYFQLGMARCAFCSVDIGYFNLYYLPQIFHRIHINLKNNFLVFMGFNIEQTFKIRCIEVKTKIWSHKDFFMELIPLYLLVNDSLHMAHKCLIEPT